MKISTAVAAVLVSSACTFLLGSRMGATGHVQADAKLIASLASAKLMDLDSGNLERLRESLELTGMRRSSDTVMARKVLRFIFGLK